MDHMNLEETLPQPSPGSSSYGSSSTAGANDHTTINEESNEDPYSTQTSLSTVKGTDANGEEGTAADLSFNSSKAMEVTLGTDQVDNSLYYLKWIKFRDQPTPVITQNNNGPCPLIAIMNVLLLKRLVKLPKELEWISTTELMKHLGHYLINKIPQSFGSEEEKLNYEHNISDAISLVPKLQSGLDVNVGFSSVNSYELTPEIVIFDILGVRLYHGWLVDPQEEKLFVVMSELFYNRAVELAMEEGEEKSVFVKQFLETNSNQLTYHGLFELTSHLKESEVAVLFRNNHFSTITKQDSVLYQLVTDQGFLQEDSVVWELLSSVSGDNEFTNSFFKKTSHLQAHREPMLKSSSTQQDEGTGSSSAVTTTAEQQGHSSQSQLSDHELALKLAADEAALDERREMVRHDEELAKRLQREEEERADEFVDIDPNNVGNNGAIDRPGRSNIQNRRRRTSPCSRGRGRDSPDGGANVQEGESNKNCIIL